MGAGNELQWYGFWSKNGTCAINGGWQLVAMVMILEQNQILCHQSNQYRGSDGKEKGKKREMLLILCHQLLYQTLVNGTEQIS